MNSDKKHPIPGAALLDEYMAKAMRAEKKNLYYFDLDDCGVKHGGGQWYPHEWTPLAQYIKQAGVKAPTHRWKNAYAKACMTRKCARWLIENAPDFARVKGLI